MKIEMKVTEETRVFDNSDYISFQNFRSIDGIKDSPMLYTINVNNKYYSVECSVVLADEVEDNVVTLTVMLYAESSSSGECYLYLEAGYSRIYGHNGSLEESALSTMQMDFKRIKEVVNNVLTSQCFDSMESLSEEFDFAMRENKLALDYNQLS